MESIIKYNIDNKEKPSSIEDECEITFFIKNNSHYFNHFKELYINNNNKLYYGTRIYFNKKEEKTYRLDLYKNKKIFTSAKKLIQKNKDYIDIDNNKIKYSSKIAEEQNNINLNDIIIKSFSIKNFIFFHFNFHINDKIYFGRFVYEPNINEIKIEIEFNFKDFDRCTKTDMIKLFFKIIHNNNITKLKKDIL